MPNIPIPAPSSWPWVSAAFSCWIMCKARRFILGSGGQKSNRVVLAPAAAHTGDQTRPLHHLSLLITALVQAGVPPSGAPPSLIQCLNLEIKLSKQELQRTHANHSTAPLWPLRGSSLAQQPNLSSCLTSCSPWRRDCGSVTFTFTAARSRVHQVYQSSIGSTGQLGDAQGQ